MKTDSTKIDSRGRFEIKIDEGSYLQKVLQAEPTRQTKLVLRVQNA